MSWGIKSGTVTEGEIHAPPPFPRLKKNQISGVSERLVSLNILGTQLRLSLNPLAHHSTIEPYIVPPLCRESLVSRTTTVSFYNLPPPPPFVLYLLSIFFA